MGVWVLMLLLVLIIAGERGVWAPARSDHAAAKAQLIALQSARAQLQARVDAIAPYSQAETALSVLEVKLAAPIDRSGVVEILADVSTAANTQIIHGANTFGQSRGAVRPVLQDLTVEGSYGEIADFLTRLGQVDTLTLLRRAEFSTNADGTLVRVQLKLMTLSSGASG